MLEKLFLALANGCRGNYIFKVRFVVKLNYVCHFSFTLFTHAGPSLVQVNSTTNLQTSERSLVAELKQEKYVNIAPNLKLFVMQE